MLKILSIIGFLGMSAIKKARPNTKAGLGDITVDEP
jgi:hypothetical protein